MLIWVVIIAFNNPTYVSDMVNQLLKYTNNIIIVDNCSTYPKMIEYLETIEKNVKVFRMEKNYGHNVHKENIIQSFIDSDIYCITDPDLRFNTKLPENFIETFAELTEIHNAERVGFALDITTDIRDDIHYQGKLIKEWESNFWNDKIEHPSLVLYKAAIDTTFCLINKKYTSEEPTHIRVAGDFTCVHRPWLTYSKTEVPEEELNYYMQHATCSCWVKINT
jgi:glycosyltransferase involved in cell wall biosynthesis